MNEFRGHPGFAWVCMLIAFILEFIYTLVLGGFFTAASVSWMLPGGLAAAFLAFLIGW